MRPKSGLPENSSPSTQTVPASIASCSVCEMTGRKFMAFIAFITASDTCRRIGVMRKTAARTTNAAVSHSGAPNPTRATSPAAAHAQSGAPVKPSANRTRSTPRTAAQTGVPAKKAKASIMGAGWAGIGPPRPLPVSGGRGGRRVVFEVT